MKKFFLVLLIIIFVLLAGGVLYLGYLGFVPGLSSLFGSDKPKDLGIVWTEQDYSLAIEKSGVEIAVASLAEKQLLPEQTIIQTGSHQASVSFTDNELSALITKHQDNWIYYPVSNVQMKISDNGGFEISGILNVDRLSGYAAATGADYGSIETVKEKFKIIPDKIPFYASGSASAANGIASVNFSQGELGRLAVPQDMINDNQSAINGFFTQQINAFPGFFIKNVSMSGGELNFDGTLADKVETYK